MGNKRLNQQRQAFLLTFFPDRSSSYEEKEVNGFTLVKHIVNGDPKHLEVAIYPPGSFTGSPDYTPKKKQSLKKQKVRQLYAEMEALNKKFFDALADEE